MKPEPQLTDTSICVRQLNGLSTVSAEDWDALTDGLDPFVRHAFLAGLESQDCLTSHSWQPCHLTAWQADRLVGAMPLYMRWASEGEFVFDWNWAEAHQRAIGPYYPKLVTAIPFTPVTGPRLLVHPDASDPGQVRKSLVAAALEFAEAEAVSSWHVLFPDKHLSDELGKHELLPRRGCQYHWYNDHYADFDAFLMQLTSRRRKEIRRERRSVSDSDLKIEVLQGAAITDQHWEVFYPFYCNTFLQRWGRPRLTLAFLQHLSRSMPEVPLLFLARDGSRYVAGALALCGRDTLYGRHWGCNSGYRNLHFELCYYQTIDFCIGHNLAHLDAGAQGEHKMSRGFVPVKTCSNHWLRDARFRSAVADFLQHEHDMIDRYMQSLASHTAYRQTGAVT